MESHEEADGTTMIHIKIGFVGTSQVLRKVKVSAVLVVPNTQPASLVRQGEEMERKFFLITAYCSVNLTERATCSFTTS